jgi:hypothetical protein
MVFSRIDALARESAYVKSDFGILDQPATAHVETIRLVGEDVLFDCGKPRPCQILFSAGAMVMITPSVVSEKKVEYRFIPD